MLDKMRAHGYIREAHDHEADEFGIGWVAVLDDTEEGPFKREIDAKSALVSMRCARAIRKARNAG